VPDDDEEPPTTALRELFRIERLTGVPVVPAPTYPVLIAAPDADGALRAPLLRTADAPTLLILDRPKAAEPEELIDVILPVAPGHCRHERCCQCGAARGTPEHARVCPDAALARAFAKRREGYTPRKLRKRP